MKKVMSLLLALVLCLALCACGKDSTPTKPADTEPTDSTETQTAPMVFTNEDGILALNLERFSELVERIELTTENWTDYIAISSYTEETVDKDAFGEIVSTDTSTKYVLGSKEKTYYILKDFVIELKNTATGALTIYNSADNPSLAEDFDLAQYECTRIKGTLFLIDLPAEVISANKYGTRYFLVGYTDYREGPCHTFYIAGTDGYAVDGPTFAFTLFD